MAFVLREATREDLPALADLNEDIQRQHAEVHPDDFRYPTDHAKVAKFFAAVMRHESNRIVLAEQDGAAVGYLWFEIQRRRATALKPKIARLAVHHIFVRSACRRQGIAEGLMTAAQEAAHAADCREIVLDTWASNIGAQSFFAAQGYEVYRLVLRKPAGPI